MSETGVKAKYIFNEILYYLVIRNVTANLMHDGPEGFINFVSAKFLLYYILEKKYFNMDYVNRKLNSIDFWPESSNKPIKIKIT